MGWFSFLFQIRVSLRASAALGLWFLLSLSDPRFYPRKSAANFSFSLINHLDPYLGPVRANLGNIHRVSQYR